MQQQRRIILAKVLGLKEDESYEAVFRKAQDMFFQGRVTDEKRELLQDAYAKLHIRAVKRLVSEST